MKTFPWKLYIYKFFDDFIIIYPLYALMFADKGVSTSGISILFFTWSITSFVFEIPSGVLADRYDRRWVLIIGQIIRALGYVSWLVIPNFAGFWIGFLCWGIKSAMTSGTLEAYIYDGLKNFGIERSFTKVYGRVKTLSFVGILSASFLATILSPLGYQFILILSIGALVISASALLSAPSIKMVGSTHEREYVTILSKGIRLLIDRRQLFVLVMLVAFIMGIMAIDEYLPLYIQESDVDVRYAGVFLGIYSLLQAVVSFLSHKVDITKSLFSIIITTLGGVLLLLSGVFVKSFGLLMILFVGAISTFLIVRNEEFIQKHSSSDIRATVSSVKGFFAEIFAFGTFIAFSALSSVISISAVFIILGGVWIIVGGLLNVGLLKQNNVHIGKLK